MMSAAKQYHEATKGLTRLQRRLLRRLARTRGKGLAASTVYSSYHDLTISSLKGRGLIRFEAKTRRIRLTRMGTFWAAGG
jgi:hypothetical protein